MPASARETNLIYGDVITRQFTVCGSGRPIILLHGYSDSARTWGGVLAAFARAGQQALAVDMPGFGRASQRPRGPIIPVLDAFVRDLASAHADDDGAVLVGNSLGAMASIRAAAAKAPGVAAVIALDEPTLGFSRLHRYMA